MLVQAALIHRAGEALRVGRFFHVQRNTAALRRRFVLPLVGGFAGVIVTVVYLGDGAGGNHVGIICQVFLIREINDRDAAALLRFGIFLHGFLLHGSFLHHSLLYSGSGIRAAGGKELIGIVHTTAA